MPSKRRISTSTTAPSKACGIASCPSSPCSSILKRRLGRTMPDSLEKIIRRERPQALLPTMGGQTALNLAVALADAGVLERYGVELIGAKLEAIKKAEDRDLFKQVMQDIGLVVPRGTCITSADEAPHVLAELGLPLIIRPSFTLGGTGGNVAHTLQEFEEYVAWGLATSPQHQVLIEASVLGWKEY